MKSPRERERIFRSPAVRVRGAKRRDGAETSESKNERSIFTYYAVEELRYRMQNPVNARALSPNQNNINRSEV